MELQQKDFEALQAALDAAGEGAQLQIASPKRGTRDEWECSCAMCGAHGKCGFPLPHKPTCPYVSRS